jgi:hypothetical protein
MMLWPLRAALVSSLGAVIALACGGADTVAGGYLGCGPLYYGGGGVPEPPDGPSLCGAGVCNYQTQGGCGAGETCAPSIDSKTKSTDPACRAAGTVETRGTCDDERLCAKGLICIKSPPDAETGTCRKLCCGADWTACSKGESCIRQLDASTADGGARFYAEVDLCYPVGTCNVLDPNACADERRTCRIVDPTGAVACAPPSTLKRGDPCSAAQQCGPVLHCVAEDLGPPGATTDGPLTCRKLCPWAKCAETGCESNEKCVHFDRDPPGVGECTANWTGPPIPEDAGLPDGATLPP